MRKVFLFLSAIAALTIVSCNKSNVVKDASMDKGEISFKVLSSNPTKAGELTGISLPKTYGIYAAATQKNAGGLIENPSFFASPFEQLFGTDAADPTGVGTRAAVADTRQWRAGTYTLGAYALDAQYWPIGGAKMDFLAYSIPMADHNDAIPLATTVNTGNDWAVKWDNQLTDVASQFTFYDVDTYANQIDLMYAIANDQTSAANGGPAHSVAMEFNHAQALLIFNVRVNEAAAGKMTINEIGFYTDGRVQDMLDDQVAVAGGAASSLAALADNEVTLKTFGTFRVDNSRNNLIAGWCYGENMAGSAVSATKKENYKMPSGTSVSNANKTLLDQGDEAGGHGNLNVNYGSAIGFSTNTALDPEYFQLGETLLIPEQEKVNFTIKYTVGGKTLFYTYNDLRGVWEMGKKYIYNLDLTLNEIVVTESVVDFVAAPGVVAL